jgi:MFS family permease
MGTSLRERALVPVLVGVTLVTSTISGLGAPLIPDVAQTLHVSLDAAQWSLTAALLSGAITAPIMGRIGDGPHRRRALLALLVVCLVGSVVAGVAESLGVLILGRTMQGVGLGLAAITMATARDSLPLAEGTRVIGLLSVSGAAGVGAAYPLSGLISDHLGLHAAFLFGGVIAGAALIGAAAVVPPSDRASGPPLDVGGAGLGAAGVVMLLLAIGQGEAWGWSSASIVGLFAAALLTLTAWARYQLGRESPLVDLHLLRHRAVLTANVATALLGVSFYMYLTLVTAFVQAPPRAGYGFDSSALTAGLCLLPFAALSLVAARLNAPLTQRIGARATLIAGSLAIAAAGSFFALVHDALWQALTTMGVIGVGFGFTFAAIPGLITRAVPSHELGSALGFFQVVRAIAFSIGSALTASILAAHIPAGAHLPTEHGYVVALWVGVAFCVIESAIAVVLAPREGVGVPSPRLERTLRDEAELASAGLIGAEIERR